MTSDLIVITDINLPGEDAELALTNAGHHVLHGLGLVDENQAAHVTALMVQWENIDEGVMDRFPNLKFISRLGIGCDMIDLEAASARGILVANTPIYCVEEVATHSIALILAMCRGLVTYDRAVRSGAWSAVTAPSLARRPSSLIVSVIGYGRIGSIVAAACSGLGFKVVVSDPGVSSELISAAGHTPATFEKAVTSADILTLHAPLVAETHHMIDARALESMKTGSIVVNTCRGALIEEIALVEALRSGHLGGAALDVFEAEPLPSASLLRGMDNVLLTPHASWYSPESLVDLPKHAASNIVEFFAGRHVPSVVNR